VQNCTCMNQFHVVISFHDLSSNTFQAFNFYLRWPKVDIEYKIVSWRCYKLFISWNWNFK
jgi:hypothetical protein